MLIRLRSLDTRTTSCVNILFFFVFFFLHFINETVPGASAVTDNGGHQLHFHHSEAYNIKINQL